MRSHRQHKSQDLFLLSVRVLTRCVDGPRPSRRDVVTLRENAKPSEADLPLEEICCAVIMRELRRRRSWEFKQDFSTLLAEGACSGAARSKTGVKDAAH